MRSVSAASRGIKRACAGALALGAVLVALPAASAAAATITVNTTADNPPSAGECSGTAGDCSLRQALDKATVGDTVSVPANASDYQVTVTPIDIPGGVSIVGGGASSTTITGGGNNEIFNVSTTTSQTDSISALTITDGFNNTGGDNAGAINLGGNLKLDQVAITNSRSPEWGGAIEGGGTLTITRSRFSGDSATRYGGGAIDFFNDPSPSHLSISDTSFVNNTAGFGGGLIAEGGTTFALDRVTFSGDSATTVGGGMEAEGAGTLYNATFTGDSATTSGGGLEVEGTTSAVNDTFAKNTSAAGANVHASSSSASFSVENSIFSKPSGSASCAAVNSGKIIDNGNNLEDAATSSCGFTTTKHDIVGKSADLGSLANNGNKVAAAGGPPQTLALGKTSPALHAASASGCTTVGSVDERKMKRPGLAGSACDIGAYELQVSKPKVSITRPRNHARYTQGKVVHAKYRCKEGTNGPGIKSCKGTVANGKSINTKKLGKHTFSVTAISKDGLKVTRKVTYTVVKAKPASTAPGFTG